MTTNALEQADAGQQTDQTNSQADPAVEKRARDLGWVPETEWRGDPPKGGFKSAEDFVKHGEEVLPIVKSQVKRLEADKAELASRLERMEADGKQRMERMERATKAALEHQRETLERKYAEAKEAAVETGDVKKYRELDKQHREELAELDKKTAEPEGEKDKPKGPQLPAHIKQTIDKWVDENSTWYADEEMRGVAIARHGKLLKEKPGLSIEENLAQVRDYVKKRFPENFGVDDGDDGQNDDPPPRRGSPVEGGSRGGGRGGSLYSRMPKEDQAIADRFIKDDKLFLEKGETVEKDLAKARERFAKQYFGE